MPSEILSLTRIYQAQKEDTHSRNCVRLYEVYEDDEFVHMVLENCRGNSMSHLIQMQTDEENPIQYFKCENDIKNVLRQLLHSIKCLHDVGIVHRDLKLDNIMMDEGEIRIIDFGLSKIINPEEKEKLTTVVGTPHYIAPEIFNNSYDEKCDVWSLGVIAYQLFSQGEFPFEGDNEIQIFKAIRKGKFYLPEEQTMSI